MSALDRIFKATPLFLTWDIAKTYDRKLNCNHEVEDYMYKNVDRIKEIHAHDAIKDFRSHQTIGSGNIDFSKYYDIFMLPDVSVTIEVRPREEATASRIALLNILENKLKES